MAKHIDLTNKLSSEKPSIKIGETEFTINDEKTNVLIMNQVMKDESLNSIERTDKMIEILLGKRQFKKLEDMKLSFKAYETIAFALMAAVNDEELEDVEKRFQKQQ